MKRNVLTILLVFTMLFSLFFTTACDYLVNDNSLGNETGDNITPPGNDSETGNTSKPEDTTGSDDKQENEEGSADSDNNSTNSGVSRDLHILYSTSNPNIFLGSFLNAFGEEKNGSEKVSSETFIYDPGSNSEIPNSGYDVYIYEKYLPKTMPTEGLCIIIDPQSAPQDAGFSLGTQYVLKNEGYLISQKNHPILDDVVSDGISVTRFTEIVSNTYTPILYFSEYPVAFASEKSVDSLNAVVLSFNLNYSNLAILADFPIIMYNIIEYYTSLDTGASSKKEASSSGTSMDIRTENNYDPFANQILDGCTYYKDVLEDYLDRCNERLNSESHGLTQEQISIINKYFTYLSIYQ